jgi:demethylmenaquinone methyltransferase/2-methoxy-6-polyprenyl-1,4-benzoquinol methylase
MLFYDEAEADRMFAEAGFVDVEHRILQAKPGSPKAIATVARAPERSERVDRATGSSTSAERTSGESAAE